MYKRFTHDVEDYIYKDTSYLYKVWSEDIADDQIGVSYPFIMNSKYEVYYGYDKEIERDIYAVFRIQDDHETICWLGNYELVYNKLYCTRDDEKILNIEDLYD